LLILSSLLLLYHGGTTFVNTPAIFLVVLAYVHGARVVP
jgi:hypothetical protein